MDGPPSSPPSPPSPPLSLLSPHPSSPLRARRAVQLGAVRSDSKKTIHRFAHDLKRRKIWEVKVCHVEWRANNNSFLCVVSEE